MKCKSRMQILEWFKAHDLQTIKDDIQFFEDRFDLSLEENATVSKIITKLKQMIS
ncbi:MAG: hypothetical protein WCH62_04125 [Candidatus Omnitrophota bacterium]